MPFHCLDSLLILDVVFELLSEPFKNVENIFSATLNCLNQKFHSAHFSTVGLAKKEGLPITKAYLFVPYFKLCLAAISVSPMCVCSNTRFLCFAADSSLLPTSPAD